MKLSKVNYSFHISAASRCSKCISLFRSTSSIYCNLFGYCRTRPIAADSPYTISNAPTRRLLIIRELHWTHKKCFDCVKKFLFISFGWCRIIDSAGLSDAGLASFYCSDRNQCGGVYNNIAKAVPKKMKGMNVFVSLKEQKIHCFLHCRI